MTSKRLESVGQGRRRLLIVALLANATAFGIATRPAIAQDKKESQDDKIQRLVRTLGSDDYKARDAAEKELVAIGRPALAALEKAAKDDKDAEVRARASEAAISIRKNIGAAPAQPGAGNERSGELEPDEPPIEPQPDQPQPPPQRQPGRPQPGVEDFFKGIPKDLPQDLMKMLERFQKQIEELDRQTERELETPNGRGRVRTWTFSNVPKPARDAVEMQLGFALGPTTAALRAQLSLGPTEGGIVVNEIVKDGWADKAGLKLYDVIVGIDGRAVRTSADLATVIEKDTKLDVIRKAKLEKIDAPRCGSTPRPLPVVPSPEPTKPGDKKDDAPPPTRKF